ncbi:MAG: heme-binding protein [Asticcacaulis sp.]
MRAQDAPVVYTLAPGPSLETSLKLARAALDACQARGFAASASVVDSAGRVKVTLRADGAPKPPVAAPLKAATAAAFDAPGSVLEPRSQTDATFAAEMDAHKDIYNDHPGSLPLHKDGQVFGGLAVADVPHDVADTCARAALDAAAPELK